MVIAQLANERARLLDSQISLMRDAGMISPEGLSSVAKIKGAVRAAKYDWVRDTNRHLRKSLSERGLELPDIEEILDEIVTISGLASATP